MRFVGGLRKRRPSRRGIGPESAQVHEETGCFEFSHHPGSICTGLVPRIPDPNPLVILMNALASLSSLFCIAPAVGRAARWSGLGTVASLCVVLASAPSPLLAAEAAAVAKSAARAAPKVTSKTPSVASKKAPPAEAPPVAATEDQFSAAQRVYYGEYQCDFKQVIHITASERHPAYVDLQFAKASYLMKPVLSSTGAIRLEDVKGQTLMIQIARKSMLMNVKSGSRLVDECVSPGQRAEIEAAERAAALESANAVGGASINAAATPLP